jgi:site-specific recombinase XerC
VASANLVIPAGATVPALVASAGGCAGIRFLEFFASAIRNPHTRRAYALAASDFLAWCAQVGVASITAVQPLHVAAWIERQTQTRSAPTVRQRLAAIRHLFDWLVIGQIVPHNPAASVRGPSHTAKKGKTPVLDATEARQLLDSIDVTTPIGLRDRALIALMVFAFARIGAALAMRVEDVYEQQRRLWVRLREKGGKAHEMPCHHTLEAYLHAYLDGTGLGGDPKGPLFRTVRRGTGQLSITPLPQANAYAMVRRRAVAACIGTKIGNHTFRATGITAYLKNGGTLENAAAMANHASTRATQRYNQYPREVQPEEVERLSIGRGRLIDVGSTPNFGHSMALVECPVMAANGLIRIAYPLDRGRRRSPEWLRNSRIQA